MTTPSRATLEKALKSDAKVQAAATQIANELNGGTYNISDLAEQLGFALTSSDTAERVAGTNLLSAVLNALPNDLLNAKQLEFLTTFYTDRLRDHHNVMPAIIDGLSALVRMKELPPANVTQLLQAFFQYTTCQSQTRGDRTKIFNMLEYLTLHFQPELVKMSGDFLYGLINSIDGERDPRNLDIIFGFMPEFIARYPLLHLAEEMFEIFACYFPIDFTRSKQDPEAITRDALAEKLTNCLVASEQFAEWIVALAVEKLDSELLVAKLDSIELLHQAALQFSPAALEPHFDQIWQALKAETFPGSENDNVVRCALKTLAELLKSAAKEPRISHNYQTIVLGVVLTHLTDVHQRLFHPASAIAMMCVSGDAAFAGDKILNTFQLKLQSSQPLSLERDEQRIRFYHIISQVYKLAGLRNVLQRLDTAIVLPLQDDVIAALRLCERDDFDDKQQDLELQRAALAVLCECAPVLSETQRALVYKALVQLISHPTIDLNFKPLTVSLGALQPVELQSNFIDVCMRNFDIFAEFIKRKIYDNLLPLLPQVAFTQRILELVMKQVFSATAADPVRLLALEALNSLLKQEDQRFVVELQQQSNLLHKLIELAQQTTPLTEASLEQIAGALSLIMQQLPLSEQSAIVSEYLPGLQLQLEAHLFVAKGLLGYLHKDIAMDDHFERLLNDLTQLSLSSDNEQLRETAHHLLCSLVNKMDNTKANREQVKRITDRLKKALKRGDKRAVDLLAWIAKGLVVAGFEEAADIVGDLSDLLEHPTLSSAAALAFDVIAAEFPELDLPVVKYLYKQKFFHTIMNKLGSKLGSYCEHHMKAFIYVLKETPHSVIKLNINQLGPLLFKTLDDAHKDSHSLCIVLQICESFVQQKDAYFQAHLGHLIPSCLKLTKLNKDLNMQVRIAALQLVLDITTYPTYVLLPHKQDVTLALAPALDDPKRLVRNVAVTARNAWYLVGAPGGED
ncbi:LOW QUALITY PROTEIN: MMS19 nucleotide excision repair protein [Drosophila sulfurigaster albostrigata]|uniref:LOW QUALITY PROTEIN: MMS19 nucleotide excision repair protein n=1 Tax=Drosophila sulfurigaster albostrigata TaxID=89887 RepID=UPI002D21DCD5|nr:LOW QUALITY PROTEIN: MMS19 nucleotide excision repair protein [Drosophila sulfurigaster albostrigata]